MRIDFATTNQGKLKEVKQTLDKYGITVNPVVYSIAEGTEGTVEYIAKQKLIPLIEQGYHRVMVEDSGIFLEAYAGFPGILSKRVFKQIGYKGFAKLLENESRKAWFEGAIAVYWHGEIKVFSASMPGEIIEPFPEDLKHEPGLPFDPIFVVQGEKLSFQQLDEQKRQHYSYRRIALERMVQWVYEK